MKKQEINKANDIQCFDDLMSAPCYDFQVKNRPRHLFNMGQITTIKAYKYDGTLYRQYEGAKIIANLNDFVVVLLMKSKVQEKDINWVVSDPILFFFAKNHFYNASVTLNKNKPNYIYVNLASPFFIDKQVIKYIDLDIDIKSYIDKEFNVIDWMDFKTSIEAYNYPLELIYRLYDELDFLYDQFKNKNGVFSKNLTAGIEKMLRESGDI
ncbi:hypothetical protein JN00_0048 [Metamycoplasma subdolum]|uniref:DUF402 domain-containing protein n=1 Tax=Metamycoplasma subdolum TaxID=92407 RepID=A0A3M0A3H4_9BACT|nr:DUF402 domain-containing protein [Metamycoplasma subdolum]RMA79004.1 hypothetical protein JN00_0048 [Metamycoplasma subdolum]WPB50527.1 DUF402 domain-containing protein [Metamycoplasma subdolum]